MNEWLYNPFYIPPAVNIDYRPGYYSPRVQPVSGSYYPYRLLGQGLHETPGLTLNAARRDVVKPSNTPGGINVEGALNVAAGAASLYNQAASMVNEAQTINTVAPSVAQGPAGMPVYNLGGFAAETERIQPKGASGSELVQATLTGAKAGLAVGNPVAAAVGATVGLLTGIFAGRRRKRLMARKKEQAWRSLQGQQLAYSKHLQAFNENEAAKQAYADQLNMNNRMLNLYMNDNHG